MRRSVQDPNFQWKAVLKAEQIAAGEKVLAPEYTKDADRKKMALEDPKLTEELAKKDEDLIKKINENIKITSTDPPERWTSVKDLPTRETEFLHRHDTVWEYGFYEPPLEKMDRNHLMLREALEILRIRIATEGDLAQFTPSDQKEKMYRELEEHPATKRVDQKKLDLLWKYFRPFVSKKDEVVARKEDYNALLDYASGVPTEEEYTDTLVNIKNFKMEELRQKLLRPLTEEEERLQIETSKVKDFFDSEMKRLDERSKKLKELEAAGTAKLKESLKAQDEQAFREYEEKMGQRPKPSQVKEK
uniref:Uncharacterized protein n=1 Tax=Acrobeloides nanus TaxID=290746 RepID=A0A914BXT5_9BILA